MSIYRLSIPLIGLLIAGWSTTLPFVLADDETAASKALDQKFEALLVAAQKDPQKADWKALRHAFSETSHYEPYNISWRKDILKVGKDIWEGNVKAAEAALVKLLERERFMRIDGHAMALALYEKTGDSDKARKHRDFLEGLSSVVFVPGHGTSFEKPIEVLFVDEEYALIGAMGLKIKDQALTERGGHHFDVLTTGPKAGEPERQFYFNIDMPWSSLQSSMNKLFDGSKVPAGKK
jgi:Domain of unknown function (DUF4919)